MITREEKWWLRMAEKEGDYPVGAVGGPAKILRCACCGEAEPQNGWSYAAYLCNNDPDEVFCTSKCFEAHEDRLCKCFSDDIQDICPGWPDQR